MKAAVALAFVASVAAARFPHTRFARRAYDDWASVQEKLSLLRGAMMGDIRASWEHVRPFLALSGEKAERMEGRA